MDGGTAQRHPFKIFALAVFRVALRVGTKIRGARSERMGWARQDTVNELIDGSRDWAKTMPAHPNTGPLKPTVGFRRLFLKTKTKIANMLNGCGRAFPAETNALGRTL
jgi:hypothetical protein